MALVIPPNTSGSVPPYATDHKVISVINQPSRPLSLIMQGTTSTQVNQVNLIGTMVQRPTVHVIPVSILRG